VLCLAVFDAILVHVLSVVSGSGAWERVRRQAIYFERPQDLLACLEAIHRDPSVRVCRVTNRLRPDYDARRTAGYRDVALNLRLDNRETRELCIENHIAELQLLLIPFAHVKTEQGHWHYINWRNVH